MEFVICVKCGCLLKTKEGSRRITGHELRTVIGSEKSHSVQWFLGLSDP